MTVYVYKAQPTGDQVIPDMRLAAVKPFPDHESPADGTDAHSTDAQFIVSAMLASLPGGTVDAVLRLLLQHRASLLRVRWPK